MRQALELLVSLISTHPDEATSKFVKSFIVRNLVQALTHQAARPLVKPAFKCLECFLGKGTITPNELLETYQVECGLANSAADASSWDTFISQAFERLRLADVAPSSGKLLVTLFILLKDRSIFLDHALSWQQWIRNGLRHFPETLENVKNYLLSPLFKLDRPGSLFFLQELTLENQVLSEEDRNAQTLLWLATMEVGKKAGLVQEPGSYNPNFSIYLLNIADDTHFRSHSKSKSGSIALNEEEIGRLMTSSNDVIRSFAFSVLVSSLSSTKPFSTTAMSILKQNLGAIYGDSNAKTRNDILSCTKHMIERLRGAMVYMQKDMEMLCSQNSHSQQNTQLCLHGTTALNDHKVFFNWYIRFLLQELSPTVSYPRHITSLKAILLLLRSGILSTNAIFQAKLASTIRCSQRLLFAPWAVRLFLDLLMDPFEHVRVSSSAVLKLACSHGVFSHYSATSIADEETNHLVVVPFETAPSLQVQLKDPRDFMSELECLIVRAERLSKRTRRADYADAVARGYDLRFTLLRSTQSRLDLIGGLIRGLELKVHQAKSNLAEAVSDCPVHASFAALK